MTVEYINCTHCKRKHALLHCDHCGTPLEQDTPGIFIGSLQFNSAAHDQNRAVWEESGKEHYERRAGRSATNLCMPCAQGGTDLARLILADERQWPERTV